MEAVGAPGEGDSSGMGAAGPICGDEEASGGDHATAGHNPAVCGGDCGSGVVLLFLDEIDALAGARGSSSMHEATRRTLSVLLRKIDGFEADDAIVVIGATNRWAPKGAGGSALYDRHGLKLRHRAKRSALSGVAKPVPGSMAPPPSLPWISQAARPRLGPPLALRRGHPLPAAIDHRASRHLWPIRKAAAARQSRASRNGIRRVEREEHSRCLQIDRAQVGLQDHPRLDAQPQPATRGGVHDRHRGKAALCRGCPRGDCKGRRRSIDALRRAAKKCRCSTISAPRSRPCALRATAPRYVGSSL